MDRNLVSNLAGGWLFMGMVVLAFPELGHTVVEVGSHEPRLGAMAFAGLGNLVGGIGLVTLLRLVQAGGRAVSMVRE